MIRPTSTRRRLVAGLTAGGIALASPLAAPAGAVAADPAATGYVRTATVPYVAGTSIAWTAGLVPLDYGGALAFPTDLSRYPGATLTGVGGGAIGIVVVGWDGVLATLASWVSTDAGRTWTEHPDAGANSRIVARRGVFVSYGAGFRSSTDGSSWSGSSPVAPGSSAEIASGVGGFVALVRGTTRTRAWTSSDGRSWRLSSSWWAIRDFCPFSIAANSSRAVAVGAECSGARRTRIFVTADGRTWRSVAAPPGMPAWSSLSYASGRFVAIGPYGVYPADGTAVWSSKDGISWRRTSFVRRLGESPDRVGSVVRFGGGWVAVGFGDADAGDCRLRAWKTADLEHWARLPMPEPSYTGGYCTSAVQAAVTGGRLVVVGNTSGPNPTGPVVWIGELL